MNPIMTHYYFEIKHYILHDEVQKREVVLQDERVCVLKMELMETTFLLKKEEMNPRLGGSTDVLLIYGRSFFSTKNGPG
jgi:hypothetical protein